MSSGRCDTLLLFQLSRINQLVDCAGRREGEREEEGRRQEKRKEKKEDWAA